MKIAFYTLGCKTNQFETQALEQLFANAGCQIVPFDAFADVYIVNTCTVTALSDKKSRNAARRAKKINPAACLIVCGCYSQINPQEAQAMTGADIIIGTQNKGRIVELALNYTAKDEGKILRFAQNDRAEGTQPSTASPTCAFPPHRETVEPTNPSPSNVHGEKILRFAQNDRAEGTQPSTASPTCANSPHRETVEPTNPSPVQSHRTPVFRCGVWGDSKHPKTFRFLLVTKGTPCGEQRPPHRGTVTPPCTAVQPPIVHDRKILRSAQNDSGEYATNDRLEYATNDMAVSPTNESVEIPLPPGGLIGRTRALIKVQDGCQNYCTYCIIPYARGKCRSIPLAAAAEQAQSLQAEGYLEIVITGIEVSSYGIDFAEKPPLSALVNAVCHGAPNARIRLSSLEPRSITPEFLAEIKSCHNLCPHFHLSLQSGCDNTLKRMNRKYSAARFMQSCNLLRAAYPGCAITTDLIVGFAGETIADFNESMKFIQDCALAQIHVFPYSRREGTAAFNMPNQIPKAEKARRAKIAAENANNLQKNYLKSKIGQTADVLYEQQKDGYFCGHTPQYYEVKTKSNQNLHGLIKPTKIIATQENYCIGEIITN